MKNPRQYHSHYGTVRRADGGAVTLDDLKKSKPVPMPEAPEQTFMGRRAVPMPEPPEQTFMGRKAVPMPTPMKEYKRGGRNRK